MNELFCTITEQSRQVKVLVSRRKSVVLASWWLLSQSPEGAFNDLWWSHFTWHCFTHFPSVEHASELRVVFIHHKECKDVECSIIYHQGFHKSINFNLVFEENVQQYREILSATLLHLSGRQISHLPACRSKRWSTHTRECIKLLIFVCVH